MLDLFVSHLVDLVKEKAVDLLKDQYELRSGVADKLNKIVDVLERIEAVADTADGVDLEKHKPLQAWAGKLKAAAEEARDVLDEFEYLCLERQVEEERADDVVEPCKRRKTLIGSISSSIYKSVKRFFGSTDQLERLSITLSKLEELASSTGQFLQLVADRKATDREHHKHDICDGGIRETTSSVVEPNWIGRHGVLKEIINKLLEEEPVSDGGRIPVLAVVGHGGMGKTTLAQHVINDPNVKSHFNVTMWAYVSQVFHVPTLTKKILESAAPNMTCSHSESLETLQQKLKDALKSKRFLLVLDDLWYVQNKFTMEEEWNKFCSPIAEAGGRGSKIMLTSRTPEVKDLPDVLSTIKLQGLEQDECWSIIQRCAFRGHGNLNDTYQHLVVIGKKIALKVQGSPLAAKAVGRILQNNLDPSHWLKILEKELLQFGENDVMPVLKLSYRHLPPHLRQCFAFCSIFPKGHEFNVNMLVRMWVAQGYILGRANGEETEEDIGRRYFDDLLSAGFFTSLIRPRLIHPIHNIVDDESYAVMHDLMNDLARFVSKDEFLCIEDTLQLQDGGDIPETVRHLYVSSTDYLPNLSKKGYNLSNLHTLIISSGYNLSNLHTLIISSSRVDDEVVKDVLRKLRRVRVLDLGYGRVKELPDDISHLVHLRYLDLSGTLIFRLPESLWRLYHLQVLNINMYNYPTECFAEKLNHLVKIRYFGYAKHLDFKFLSDKHLIKLTCIKGLKYLQVLRTNLVVEEGRGDEIRNLKALNELQGELVLENLDYVESGAAAREADLRGKKWLQKLQLNWSSSVRSARILGEHSFSACSPEVVADVLEGLQPPCSLEQLRIFNYPGMVCPNWMSNLWLTNLRSLELVRMPRMRKLSQEGFPSLKSLEIDGMEELEEWDGSGGFPCLEVLEIKNCPRVKKLSQGWFPSLKSLEIDGMEELEEWDGSYGFPCLEVLKIKNCPKVKKLSQEWFPSLKSLKIDGMEELEEWDGSGGFPCLEGLHIKNCPKMRALPTQLPLLRSLKLVRMPRVRKLSQEGFPSLKFLMIGDMEELEEWDGSDGFPYLEGLHIKNCPKMRALPTLFPTLTILSIVECGNLTFLGVEGLLHPLRNLEELTRCEPLRVSLLDERLRDLICLERLVIVSCPNLTWLAPKQDLGLGLLPPSLEELKLSHLCDETLSRFLHGLSNLSELDVSSSPCLKSIASREELAQLTSLQTLHIDDCQSLTAAALENLAALPSLKRLSIKKVEIKKCLGGDGEGMASGPFSLALEYLVIDNPQMLVNVPVRKSLPSVQQVTITDASRLISFSPEVERWLLQNGSSLKRLTIRQAHELQALPDLPKSLDYLEIQPSNEEFKKRYQRDIGPDWHKIQHIKHVHIW